VTTYLVSPSGNSGNNGTTLPWDPKTALENRGATVQPGDIIEFQAATPGGTWLWHIADGGAPTAHGGTAVYDVDLRGSSVAPIIVRNRLGDRIRIDGGIRQYTTSKALTKYTIYAGSGLGFEIFSASPYRDGLGFAANNQPEGNLDLSAPGCGARNMVLHNSPGSCIGFWSGDSGGGELYGNIGWGHGYSDNAGQHGNAVESQNLTASAQKKIRNNIFFNGFGNGLNLTGSTIETMHYLIERNTVFNCGSVGVAKVSTEFLLGGGSAATALVDDLTVQFNRLYKSPGYSGAQSNSFLAINNGNATRTGLHISLTDNYAPWGLSVRNIENGIVQRNVCVYAGSMAYLFGAVAGDINNTGKWTVDNNTYGKLYLPSQAFSEVGVTLGNYSVWRATYPNVDVHSTQTDVLPTNTVVFIEPNTYLISNGYPEKTGHITIYNWPQALSVPVDLSTLLTVGDSYRIMHVYDLFGQPIVSGVYGGGTVNIPMTVAKAAPSVLFDPNHLPFTSAGSYTPTTGAALTAEFGAYVVVRTVANHDGAPNTDPRGGHFYFMGGGANAEYEGDLSAGERTTLGLPSLPLPFPPTFTILFPAANAVPTTVTITPSSFNCAQGFTAQLSAVVRDQFGNIISSPVTWASLDITKATVDQNGLVTGVGPGAVTITATAGTAVGNSSATIYQDRPPYDTAHLIWAVDPDLTGNAQYLVGPLGTYNSVSQVIGSPNPSWYSIGASGQVDFGDSLDTVWTANAGWTIYAAIYPQQNDITGGPNSVVGKDSTVNGGREFHIYNSNNGKLRTDILYDGAQTNWEQNTSTPSVFVQDYKNVIAVSFDPNATRATCVKLYSNAVKVDLNGTNNIGSRSTIQDTATALRIGHPGTSGSAQSRVGYVYAYNAVHDITTIGNITAWIKANKAWTTTQDRPQQDLAHLIWALDPDLSGSAQSLVGPTGTLTTPTKTAGPPAFYTFANSDFIDFGDSLDSFWTNAAGWSIYVCCRFASGDANANRYLVNKVNGSGTSSINFWRDSNNKPHLRVYYGGGTTNFEQIASTGTNILNDGATKYILSCSFNPGAAFGSRCTLFRNGTADAGTASTGGSDGTISDITTALRIGAAQDGGLAANCISYVYAFNAVHTASQHAWIAGWIQLLKGWY